MRHNTRGFTLIELLIVVVFAGTLVLALGTGLASKLLLDRPGQTEARALTNATAFASSNKIATRRLTCAPDSDGDGYGSCTLVTDTDEKVQLQCSASWWMNFTGATGCKEIDETVRINGLRRPR